MSIKLKQRAALVGLVLVALAACTSDYRKARSEFVAGCRDSGVSSGVCNCVFEELEEHYGEAPMIAMSRGVQPDGFGERMLAAANTCRSE